MPRIFLRLPSPPTDWATRPYTALLSLLRSPRFILSLALSLLLLGAALTIWSHFSPPGAASTDASPTSYSYGVVIDAGSSSSKVQLYRWPPHNGDPAKLLGIEPVRDEYGLPLKRKVEPGVATYVHSPDEAFQSLVPLLNFALGHIPESRWTSTSLYVLCTAGMRLLEEGDQAAILGRLLTHISQEYPFHLPQDSIQVISGQMEGVFSWLTINYLLQRFDSELLHRTPGRGSGAPLVNTVGSLDMGGASLQIAFEVPLNMETSAHTVDINLGCGVHDTRHRHRVCIHTYLGSGSNAVLSTYRRMLAHQHLNSSSSSQLTVYDACSPLGRFEDLPPSSALSSLSPPPSASSSLRLQGTGDFDGCRAALLPILVGNASLPECREMCRVSGVPFTRPPVKFENLEFYGTSEFFYTMRDVLRMEGSYDTRSFERRAKEYCSMPWSVLEERYQTELYPYADYHRLKLQCFKSAWMSLVLHEGLGFPRGHTHLTTTAEIGRHNVHWSLGALLYLTRYLPLREIQLQQQAQQLHQSMSPSSWSSSPSLLPPLLTSSPFTLPCLVVLLVALLLLLCRHRHTPHYSSSYSGYCGLSRGPALSDLHDLQLVGTADTAQLSISRNLSSRKLSQAVL